MLINLRNALMAGKRLPYDAEVEYLESSGTQYIETGVTRGQTSQLRLQSTMSFSGSESANAFGWGQSLRGPCVGIKSAQPYMYFNLTGTDEYSTLTYTANTVVTIDIDGASGKVTINDGTTAYTATRAVSTWTNSGEMVLFGFTNSAGIQPRNQRIYACKIYVNGVLVRDFIPVRKGTVGYLYDRVSGKLFGNAGTGDFVVGQDVVPVEYIESHGTEWIDTGVMSSRCYGAYLDFKAIDFASYMFFVCNATADDFCVGTNANSAKNTYTGRIRRSLWYSGSIDKTAFVALSCKGGKILLNDVEKGTYDDTLPLAQNNNTIRMFGLSGTQRLSQSAIRRFDLYNSSQEAIFKALAVRVGSGSTWEGAMMDVLTRRIYRNAGTGAFTYGNDLKYPIPAE